MKKRPDTEDESESPEGQCDFCGQYMYDRHRIDDSIKFECEWCGWVGVPV